MSAGEQARAAALRQAFIAGHALGFIHGDTVERSECASKVEAKREAARRYPDPAEPRVVTDSTGTPWRYLPNDDGGGAWQYEYRGWHTLGDQRNSLTVPMPHCTPERVRLLTDLMAFPFITAAGVPCATAAG